MDKQKLDRWAEKLLDTGKSNNLIKFKDTKASSVEVLYPDVATLFSKVDGATSFEVYDPQIEEDDFTDFASVDSEEHPITNDVIISYRVDKDVYLIMGIYIAFIQKEKSLYMSLLFAR